MLTVDQIIADDAAVVVCNPTYMPHVEDVSVEKCEMCGQEVWLAGSTKKAIGDQKCHVVCVLCMIEMHKDKRLEGQTTQMPTDEQIKEVAEQVGQPFEAVKKQMVGLVNDLNRAAKASSN